MPYPSTPAERVDEAERAALGEGIVWAGLVVANPALTSFTYKIQPPPELTQAIVVEASGLAVVIDPEDNVPKAVAPGLLLQLITVVTEAVTVTYEEVAAVAESGKVISSTPSVPNKIINKTKAKIPKKPKTAKREFFSFIFYLNIK
jgi:hypothetical protein